MLISFSCNKLYSCHEYTEKKRCLNCGSLNTKKKGFIYSQYRTNRGIITRKTQRFICKACNKSFNHFPASSRIRYSEAIKKNAVKDYVTTKNSLSEVSERYNISPTSILNWLIPESKTYQSILSLQTKLPKSGVIQIDGKEFKVAGKRRVVLIATDAVSKQPFYYTVSTTENKLNSTSFLRAVKLVYGHPIKGIISDFGKGKCFVNIVERVFPGIAHQVCIVHFLRYVWLFLPRTKRSEFYWRNNMLKWIIRKILKAETRKESLMWRSKLIDWLPFFRANYHKRFTRSILKNYDHLTSHYENDFLLTNTNIIENLNRQLNRKLKNLDGFKSDRNIKPFLRIWFANYINRKENRPI